MHIKNLYSQIHFLEVGIMWCNNKRYFQQYQ